MLGFLQHQAGTNRCHLWHFQQILGQDAVIRFKRAGGDPDQIVSLAGDLVAFLHLRQPPQTFTEGRDVGFPVRTHDHGDEGGHAQRQFLTIQYGNLAKDHARLHQALNPS